MDRFLEGKVAWVTGSSRGIGRAIALALAERGADVCVHCHARTQQADSVRKLVEASGQRSTTVFGDVADPATVGEMVGHIDGVFRRLDILINNAAYVTPHHLPEADLADIHRIIDVNLKGPYNCIVAALDLLRAAKGVIVNIGSLNSRAISVAGSAYAASKAGLVAMTRNIAHDLGPLGIRINTVAPPLTTTEMGQWAQIRADSASAGISAAQRPADPREVAEIVAFVCSPAADYLSGETLYMGGGFVERE